MCCSFLSMDPGMRRTLEQLRQILWSTRFSCRTRPTAGQMFPETHMEYLAMMTEQTFYLQFAAVHTCFKRFKNPSKGTVKFSGSVLWYFFFYTLCHRAKMSDLEAFHFLSSRSLRPVKQLGSEVVVGALCGTAVLRGAHVFVPGIVSSPKCKTQRHFCLQSVEMPFF